MLWINKFTGSDIHKACHDFHVLYTYVIDFCLFGYSQFSVNLLLESKRSDQFDWLSKAKYIIELFPISTRVK